MPELRGLPGTSDVRECVFVGTAAQAIKNLRLGMAVSAASDNGAINMWDDAEGKYRCEAMRHMHTLEAKVFTNLKDVRRWVSEWLRKIQ